MIIASLFACNQKKRSVQGDIHEYAYPPPKKFVFTDPLPVDPDTCQMPQTIIIPRKPIYYTVKTKSGTKTMYLLPPETKAADSISQMHNYTSDNGLTLDAIACAGMDHFGNLWFGTAGNGISRYDGKSFTNFTEAHGLCSNQVNNILEDKNGNLWFGTWGGVSRYDGRSFVTFTTAQGLGNNIVRAILEDKNGNLWFGTDGGGVSRYDGISFKNFTTTDGLCNNSVYCILEDKAGNLWFGTNGGVSRYNGKSFTNYTTAQGLASNSVNSCTEDNSGDLWFGTAGSGVSRFDGKSFKGFTTLQGLASNLVYCALKDKQGNLWFGTDGGGVSRYDGTSFTNYKTAQGLANNNVHSIIEDKAGNIWFGTFGGGLSEYTKKPFVNYTTAQGLSNNAVITILQDKTGDVWFGTYGGGVVRYNRKSFIIFTTAQGLPNNIVISSLEDREGNLWFGTFGGGVIRYDGKSLTVFTTAQGLANDNVRGILQDKKGNIWFCTAGGGVSKYDGKVFTTFNTKQGLCYNNVISIAEDKIGNLWFGTDGGGISCYNGTSFTNYTTAQGLVNNIVYAIAVDKYGNLWFGTFGGGISRYDGKSFVNYDRSSGLPDNNIYSILFDKQEDIVIGSNEGIAVCSSFKPKLSDALIGPVTKENGEAYIRVQNNLANEHLRNYDPVFEVYNSKTGYPIKDVNGANNNGAMLCDGDGKIWVGTGNEKIALIHFALTEVTRNFTAPSMVIQNIKVNDGNLCWYNLIPHSLPFYKQISTDTFYYRSLLQQQSVMTYGKILTEQETDTIRKKYYGIHFDSVARYYPLPQNLELPYQANHITFEYAAIEPDVPYLIHYQYFLKGYDKEWSTISNKTSASFGNMDEGTYTFMLKGQSPDGTWSEPVTYTFKVIPPWYRTWWAFLFYAVGSISVLYLIFRWRTSTLIRHQKHLEQVLTERTSDLIAEKQEVENQKNKAEAQKNRAERSEQFKQQFLANMSHEIRTPMNAVSGITDLLLQKSPRPDQLAYLQAISKSSDILLHVINDILDLSKIEAGKLELEKIEFSLPDTLKQVTDTLSYKAEEKGLQLIAHIDDNVPDVLIGDPYRLNQVLINLGGNAIKFTEKGGVQIDVKQVGDENGELALHFSVTDTGIGIPQDRLQKLFESFAQVNSSDTRKFGGTGLGLSISKQLVELQGGNISVESKEGSGTTFSFVINYPIGSAEKLQQRIAAEQAIDGTVLNGLRILVADDNEYNRLVVNETLHLKADVHIDLVTNGQEAIQMLEQNDYDVILMDVQMPVMNGIDATKYIRNKMEGPKSKIPIIALTASILRANLDMCTESGMNSYIPKPFKTWQLVHSIADITGRRQNTTPSIKKKETTTLATTSITNLTYLQEFCEGDEERIKKYISLYLSALSGFEEKINTAMKTNNREEIAALMHSFKPKWMMMGMKQTNELGQKIEVLCLEQGNDEKISKHISELTQLNQRSVKELENRV